MLSHATEEPQTVTEYLQADHRRIDKLLADIHAMVDDSEIERADHAVADLHAALRRHIKLEEEILFPLFDDRAGISGATTVMRAEHERILGWLDELEKSFADAKRSRIAIAIGDLLEILTVHDQKEERILYPRADAVLSSGERGELVRRFQER